MDLKASTSTSFGFRKKKRPQGATKLSITQDDSLSPAATSTTADDDGEESTTITLDELIALRKLKRATGGIQLDRLNAGEKKRKPKQENKDDQGDGEMRLENGMVEGMNGGLSRGKDRIKDEPEPDPDDMHAKLRRGIQSNNFTGQTNAVDVDKHMMAYIEAELQKRKGGGEVDVAEELRAMDPRDELYQIGEKYKVAKQEVVEGNVTLSASMLTAIPEVDLGIDRKLKNIEETERAKRAHWEQRNKPRDDDGEFAAERFYRAKRAPESDADALAKARALAAGQAPEPQKRQGGGGGRQQHATDEMIMDRFKKRQRK